MRPVDVVRKIAPNARPEYVAAFDAGDALFQKYKVTTPKRLAHFLAQVCAESGYLTLTTENMNYSASRMMEVFGVGTHSSAVTAAEARALEHKPKEIAERVYGHTTPKGRELGNTQPGDGWRYRGAGILQTTGRFNFHKMGELTGVDFEGHPEWVFSHEHALKPALAEWDRGRCNMYADADDIMSISRIINIGNANAKKVPNGMEHRREALAKAQAALRGQSVTFRDQAAPVEPKPIEPKPVAKPSTTATNATTGAVIAAGTTGAVVAAKQGWISTEVAIFIAFAVGLGVVTVWLLWWRNRNSK